MIVFWTVGVTALISLINELQILFFSKKSSKRDNSNSFIHIYHLNNYFDFHVCLSFRLLLRPSVRASVRTPAPIPAVVSENVTNKSCLICVMSEKYAFWVTLRPQSDRCRQGEAEVRILNFKNTWSEFQMPSQTAPAEAKPRYVYSILKPHGQSFRRQVRPLLREAKPSYVYSILKPHGLSSKIPIRLLPREANL